VVAAEPTPVTGGATPAVEPSQEEVSHQPIAAKIFTGTNGVRGSAAAQAHAAPQTRITPTPARTQGANGVWSPRPFASQHNEASRSKSTSPDQRNEPPKAPVYQLSVDADRNRSQSVSPGPKQHRPLTATTNISLQQQQQQQQQPSNSQNPRRGSANEGRSSVPGASWQHLRRGSTPVGVAKFSPGEKGIMSYIGQEVANVATDANLTDAPAKKLYEGGNIPSRVFKHLQSEFSESPSNTTNTVVTNQSQSTNFSDKPRLSPGLLKLLQSDYNKLQNDSSSFPSLGLMRNDFSPTDADASSVVSSSFGEMDEYYKNGIANTASTKENVLKELTSQFDPKLLKRKPKAAPGRVFRYLQQQYDGPEEDSSSNADAVDYQARSISTSPNPDIVTKRTSPTLEYMNSLNSNHINAYRDSGLKCVNKEIYISPTCDTINNQNDGEVSHSIDEGNPPQTTPYIGKRIPGRTFRMLQENYDTHPSVLQARK